MIDEKKANAFAERLFNEIDTGMSCLNLYLGHRLGFYRAMADAGPVTAAELARKTGCNERYVREWLECMAVHDYLDHGPAGRFSLSPEHAAVLLERDAANYAAPFLQWVPSFARVLEPLIEAFRSGGGVPYEAYGSDAVEAIGLGNRPMFINDYVSKWIPALPDVERRLHNGGRVAEVGCGVGWSSISLARGFPAVRIDAVDIDAASIDEARKNAREAGVADRIVFYECPAEEAALKGPYDLVTAFECIHDMAYPVRALRWMRELASPGGAVLIADEAVGDSLDDNRSFLGRLNYNFSVLHCLPQAMVFPKAAGTGTVMRPSLLRAYAQEAGFSRVEVLSIENPLWRFYRLAP